MSERAPDRSFAITTFQGRDAKSKQELRLTLPQLAAMVSETRAASKMRLPWLKLAQFGDVPTVSGSLRHDANLTSLHGIEGDYDGGEVSLEDARARLEAAGLYALLYSTPSHTPEHPRWRVLCPSSGPLKPEDRDALCARVNGALGGILARESFTLSQAYFFGGIDGRPPPETFIIDGEFVDLVAHLDTVASGRTADALQLEEDDDDWWKPEPDWPRIKEALACIPAVLEGGSYHMWTDVGMALHHESGGSDDGFNTWTSWAEAHPKFNAKEHRSKWRSFRGGHGKQVTIATLFHLAKQHGWEEGPPPKKGRLNFLSPGECASLPSRGYVVKGIIAPRDVGCIFGAPGAGKSLIAPHLGYAVARGVSAFGMRTKPGITLYVAAEDSHGMRSRISALRLEHGDAPDFVLVDGVSDLLSRDSPDLKALSAAVQERRPSLVFIDTLAMAFPGLEENSAEQMSRVVEVARSLTKHGAAVLLVHHDTKAQGSTPRGHSLLNGALDVALHVKRDDEGIVRAKLTKNRNGSCERDIAFKITTRELSRDEDGDPVTAALVAELHPDAIPQHIELGPSTRAALDVLRHLQRQCEPGSAVMDSDWRAACVAGQAVSSSEKDDTRRRAFARAREALLGHGLVRTRGDEIMMSNPLSYNGFDDE